MDCSLVNIYRAVRGGVKKEYLSTHPASLFGLCGTPSKSPLPLLWSSQYPVSVLHNTRLKGNLFALFAWICTKSSQCRKTKQNTELLDESIFLSRWIWLQETCFKCKNSQRFSGSPASLMCCWLQKASELVLPAPHSRTH